MEGLQSAEYQNDLGIFASNVLGVNERATNRAGHDVAAWPGCGGLGVKL